MDGFREVVLLQLVSFPQPAGPRGKLRQALAVRNQRAAELCKLREALGSRSLTILPTGNYRGGLQFFQWKQFFWNLILE